MPRISVFDWPHSQTLSHVNQKLKERSLPKSTAMWQLSQVERMKPYGELPLNHVIRHTSLFSTHHLLDAYCLLDKIWP